MSGVAFVWTSGVGWVGQTPPLEMSLKYRSRSLHVSLLNLGWSAEVATKCLWRSVAYSIFCHLSVSTTGRERIESDIYTDTCEMTPFMGVLLQTLRWSQMQNTFKGSQMFFVPIRGMSWWSWLWRTPDFNKLLRWSFYNSSAAVEDLRQWELSRAKWGGSMAAWKKCY